MVIGIPKEILEREHRVAALPEEVAAYVRMGFDVLVETGAGMGALHSDAEYEAAGARMVDGAEELFSRADIVLKVKQPHFNDAVGKHETDMLREGSMLITFLHPAAPANHDIVRSLRDRDITSLTMDGIPRISRAQSMDVLSSQSNLAGYKAVVDAASEFNRALPMMMTAAGTVPPARVLVMGAGVAGLQAIATAKRMGAVVYAFDVRAAAKEQVESLGGKFVVVDEEAMKSAETAGGYAKEMGDEYKKKQAQATADQAAKADIIICTALIPGRPAPVLITEEMVKGMKPGSIIVDLAVEAGGNCPLSEYGKIVKKHGVTLMGHANVPGRVASDASMLYAKNIWNFVSTMIDKETNTLKPNLSDELVTGTMVSREGKLVHPSLAAEGGK